MRRPDPGACARTLRAEESHPAGVTRDLWTSHELLSWLPACLRPPARHDLKVHVQHIYIYIYIIYIYILKVHVQRRISHNLAPASCSVEVFVSTSSCGSCVARHAAPFTRSNSWRCGLDCGDRMCSLGITGVVFITDRRLVGQGCRPSRCRIFSRLGAPGVSSLGSRSESGRRLDSRSLRTAGGVVGCRSFAVVFTSHGWSFARVLSENMLNLNMMPPPRTPPDVASEPPQRLRARLPDVVCQIIFPNLNMMP